MASLDKELPLKAIQLEALVVMKVIKQCAAKFPTISTGSLVGMDNNGTLEITNSFPFPVVEMPAETQYEAQNFNAAAAAPRAKENVTYEREMIRMLREVNIDANNVGWYTSANLGDFVNATFIENQYFYQKNPNEKAVALVHDVSRSSQGVLSLRAFRLSASFMAAYKEKKFTTTELQKSGLKYGDILVELPITIHNSHLVTTFIHQVPDLVKQGVIKIPTSVSEVEKHPAIAQDSLAPSFDSLNLSIDPFLSQTCDNLLDAIDTHHNEANNFSYHNRQVARVQAQQAQWQAKRKAENAARALAKQPPLDETEWQRLYPLPQEPSRLESLLNSRQVEQYVRQTDGFVSSTTGKMFATRGNLLPHGESIGAE